jgi:MSHA biogenesis protein MshI
VLGWLAREKKSPGWFAISVDADAMQFAHGRFQPGAKSLISGYGTQPLADGQGLPKLAHHMKRASYECAALLRPGEYQLLLVDAPSVPREELKSALRWKIKDMIDYHVDDATVDVLDIPPPEGPAGRNHMMFAVSANNEILQGKIRQFEQARIELSVIDIPETAQRNIAALYETGERALGLVYFGEDWGLLTINFRTELYLARRLEVGLQQLSAESAVREGALERLAVEVQRTLDHFDRQFRSVPVTRMLVAPSRASGIADALKARLGIEAQDIDLSDVLGFIGEAPDKETQWRLFHHFGATLRHESKVL